MSTFKEDEFQKGNKEDSAKILLFSEDCNGFIDSVLEQIYELNLTPEQQKELCIEVSKKEYDDSTKKVKFNFGLGNEIILYKYERKYGKEITKTTHELTCNGQLQEDQIISILSGFKIIGSHRLFSYQESNEELSFNQGNEISIMIDDEESRTQYIKFGITKGPKFSTVAGCYTFDYFNKDSYKSVYQNGKNTYFDVNGKVLTQTDFVATTFGSFEDVYPSAENKLKKIRGLIESRLEEIKTKQA